MPLGRGRAYSGFIRRCRILVVWGNSAVQPEYRISDHAAAAGAGAYVLCELSAPEGYVRTKPIAVEVYSDEVTYYRDGERGQRVAAAVYGEMVTRISSNGEAVQNSGWNKAKWQ